MKLRKYRAGGVINNPNPHILYENLIKLFPELSFKARILGYDYEYEKKNIELYINTIDNIEYFIHINWEGDEVDLVQILKKIEAVLDNLSLKFDLGYYEVDKDGNQISDDINLRW